MSRAVLSSFLAVLALSACSPAGDGANQRADQHVRAACRDRINEVYDMRNREQIFAPNSSMNSPLSANYESGDASRGLADQFAYQRMQADCEHDNAVTQTAPAAPER